MGKGTFQNHFIGVISHPLLHHVRYFNIQYKDAHAHPELEKRSSALYNNVFYLYTKIYINMIFHIIDNMSYSYMFQKDLP